jgi:hypothetical protein
MRITYLAAFGLALIVTAVTGCNEAPPSVATNVDESQAELKLMDVGELYRQYTFDKKKSPASVSDLAYLDAIAPMGLMALRSGEVVARSGVVIQSVEEGPATKDPADEVLAYAKEVPTSGGLVLMHNRTVRRMTADEFKAAKMAGDGEMPAGKSSSKGK